LVFWSAAPRVVLVAARTGSGRLRMENGRIPSLT
jgi:hypothetical protein